MNFHVNITELNICLFSYYIGLLLPHTIKLKKKKHLILELLTTSLLLLSQGFSCRRCYNYPPSVVIRQKQVIKMVSFLFDHIFQTKNPRDILFTKYMFLGRSSFLRKQIENIKNICSFYDCMFITSSPHVQWTDLREEGCLKPGRPMF